ncbi:helix-turn-helix transcriptional regulator [Microbacterium sp. SORGH_AS_0862]|uniref:helix-turn-helix domain-containing protein n=1 Tax=Microbacterium sp. SORGH_AS_0862 TaxID=3041789 RepID=UPI0027931939|nr:helix-turn-helix transcriptional regulator [Microbacterium sp. SORGH_AS_0862]MDQ1204592.1 DNA-binding CsgD family transcriptional regulator [Microbacterium sp. SORGH_AS_0862]
MDDDVDGSAEAWRFVTGVLLRVFGGDAAAELADASARSDAATARADRGLYRVAATIAAVIACRFPDAAAHARRALDDVAGCAVPVARLASAAMLTADAMAGTEHGRHHGVEAGSVARAVSQPGEGALLTRYLLAEAALSSGGFEAADTLIRGAPLAPGQVVTGDTESADPAAVALQLIAARSAAFHGRRDEVRTIAAGLFRSATIVPQRALVVLQAIGGYGAAVAGDRERFFTLADAVIARTRRDENYLSVGSSLYVAWGFRAVGQLQRAAALLVSAAGADLSRCKVWDRAFATEVLVEAALSRGDTYRAGVLLRRSGALARHRVAASSLTRARGALALSQGQAADAEALAAASVRIDEAAGAATEVLRGELVRAVALAQAEPAAALELLLRLARQADAVGYERHRLLAARRWRDLAPHVEGARGDLSVMTEKQREVAVLLAEGNTNAAIAQVLYLSPRTVQSHVEDILRITGAPTRGRAAALLGPRRGLDLGLLTPRQRQVAALAAAGGRNAEIAASVGLSVKTVEHHLGEALRRLGLPSRAALATVAFAPEGSAAGAVAPHAVSDEQSRSAQQGSESGERRA